MPPHVRRRLHGLPSRLWPKCIRDSHEARLRCPDEVDGDIYKHGVPGGALNLNSTNYPDHGHHGNPPYQGKIPMVEPGIEPGTSCLVVRNAGH
jgi:hypothetical protein